MKIDWNKKTSTLDIKGITHLPTKTLDVIKIVMIGFFSIYLIGSAVPYFSGTDSTLYGKAVFFLSQGSIEYTNELMERFEGGPFSPKQWPLTVHGTAVPGGSFGIIAIGFISFIIGGEYALFYVGPVATILLFIFTERITTKFFGGFAGLVALILVATDFSILEIGRRFLTDNIFALFALLGCYYLVKFFHERKEKQILLCSVFFSLSALMRINGIIFFPVEILLISLYSLYLAYSRNILNKNLIYENSKKYIVNQKNSYLIIFNNITKLVTQNKTKIFKISILLLIPWLIFFLFFLSYNSYYFGDPSTTYRDVKRQLPDADQDFVSSFLTIDSNRFDWMKYYSIGFMPDRIKYGLADVFSIGGGASFTDIIYSRTIPLITNNWVGIFSLVIILAAIGISFIYKTKRIEVTVLFFFILGTMLFFTSPFLRGSFDDVKFVSGDTQERYMLSNLVFSSMLFSFVMINVYKINFEKISISKGRFISKSFKIIFLLILGLLLFVSFFYSTPMIDIRESTFELRDLRDFVIGFHIESGLPEKSILVNSGRFSLIFDVMPFDTQYLTKKRFDPTKINDNDILMLIDRMDEGYTVYTPKDMKPEAPKFFRYLEAEHGLILKSFSASFCKMQRLTIDVNSDTKSDDRCYTYDDIFYPKLE